MKKFSVFILVLVVLASCETFPEGGLVKRADKSLEGTWKMSVYYRDGVNETSLVYISNFTESFQSGGVYTRSYTKEDQSVVNEEGTWSIESDNLSVDISGVSSISDFSEANSTLSTSSINLVKLKKDDLWYEYENGGNQHEFRMVKQ